MNKRGNKISILGAGNVGATIAYTLTLSGLCSEIVLVDINKNKAMGEAKDISQGIPFCSPVTIHDGDYPDVANSDIIVVTVGAARKPGQSRIDLAQINVNIAKSVIPQVVRYAPNAVYVVVSNPVDILTYATIKYSGLPASQIVGSGTLLDSSRLRTRLAAHVKLNPQSVHAYVFGEHGDSSTIPWSLTNIAGMPMHEYCSNICPEHNQCDKTDLQNIEDDMRNAGADVISLKGATFYAIALATNHICKAILNNQKSILAVSTMMNGQYGIEDVCLSLPCVVGSHGITRVIAPPLEPAEEADLIKSANVLKSTIASLNF